MGQKRLFNHGYKLSKKARKQKAKYGTLTGGTNEEVMIKDVELMLAANGIFKGERAPQHDMAEEEEVELAITAISSTGDGLAIRDGYVYIVPFTAPGDVVKARPYRYSAEDLFVLTDFLNIVKPSELRTEPPKCKYFSQCSGCQFQHLTYDYQLAHKKLVVEKAFKNFSGLDDSAIPPVGDTIESPLRFFYRGKLTPHHGNPDGFHSAKRRQEKVSFESVPDIGFCIKGRRRVMDIEDCPIGTDVVRAGMKRERKRIADNLGEIHGGATLLLRESTSKLDANSTNPTANPDAIIEQHDGYSLSKTCITNPNEIATEYVDGYRFEFPAGFFFQNNNSILPDLMRYIKQHILKTNDGDKPIKHLIDAYCGSGLFTIALSDIFESSIGIEISTDNVNAAKKNANLNKLPRESVKFIAGDANSLFKFVDKAKFPPGETAVILDPPRKGCDEPFIAQLLEYQPARICYVSCNVHSQARDVGWLVKGLQGQEGMYELESVRGFDFFPQTSHVEGVAFLKRKSGAARDENVGEGASDKDTAAEEVANRVYKPIAAAKSESEIDSREESAEGVDWPKDDDISKSTNVLEDEDAFKALKKMSEKATSNEECEPTNSF